MSKNTLSPEQHFVLEDIILYTINVYFRKDLNVELGTTPIPKPPKEEVAAELNSFREEDRIKAVGLALQTLGTRLHGGVYTANR